MKTLSAITLGLVMAGSTAVVHAGGKEQQLADCKAELVGLYGEDARYRLASVKSGRNTKMRIKVSPAEGDSLVAVCWREGDRIHLEDRDGIALNGPEYDSGDKVTQAR